MNNALHEIMQLCSEILNQARLMTAYSGQIETFLFPQDHNWYVGQTDQTVAIHYTAIIFNDAEMMLSLPYHDSRVYKLFNRISTSRTNSHQFNYLLKLERKLNQLRENYSYLKQAHQAVSDSLREVNRFLSSGNECFIVNKVMALKGLHFSIQQFEKNPILHQSHCEQKLLKINALIIDSVIPPELDREAALYCIAMNVLFNKINTLVSNFRPMGTEAFSNSVIRKIIKGYPLLGCPLFGYSRSLLKQRMDIINQNLKHQFELKQKEFCTLMASLMLCYSDALVFPKNLQKYITGDRSAINFEALIEKTELDLSKTNIVRGNLVEGELYKQLDLPTSFQPVFEHYKAN